MAEPTKPLEGRSFLVVEDHALIAMDLELILLGYGAGPVEICGSASEALRLLDIHTIDVVILDVVLGKATSLPVAETLIERGTRFIFATGHDARSVLPDHLRHIPIARKPFDAVQLLEAIRKTLDTPS